MAWHSLNRVTIATAGVPQQVIVTRYGCQTVFFQQIQSNTGKIYILDSATGDKNTGTGVLATIPAPTLTTGVAIQLPWAAVTVPSAPSALDASAFWIDVDNDGDACQVSAVRN
jgi:hypothetical protein